MAHRMISRRAYVELFGPTVGDRVRLGDTDLWAEVEQRLPRATATSACSAAARRCATVSAPTGA